MGTHPLRVLHIIMYSSTAQRVNQPFAIAEPDYYGEVMSERLIEGMAQITVSSFNSRVVQTIKQQS